MQRFARDAAVGAASIVLAAVVIGSARYIACALMPTKRTQPTQQQAGE